MEAEKMKNGRGVSLALGVVEVVLAIVVKNRTNLDARPD